MLRASQFRDFSYGGHRPGKPVDPNALLNFIEGYLKWNHGVAPGYPEMMAALRVPSKSSVHRALNRLVEEGRLVRMSGRARAIALSYHRPKPVMDVAGAQWFKVERVDGEARLAPLEGK